MIKRVLIVEDSAAMRAYVRAALESAGHDVVEAASGLEALRMLPRGPYAAVVTDINMPDLSGLELISFIRRSQHGATPIVLISTEGRDSDRARGLALGANAFVTKPFTPEALLQTIEPLMADPVA
ncbi:MAG: response regulator [Deltaproteobacteria bacterium]|nr:response regulator [Deltaproteobacteria bacterium]